MYYYENEHLPYRNILIKLIIITTIILVIIWFYYSLLPKNKEKNTFKSNIDKLKNVALEYYNDNNLTTKKIKLEKLVETRKINYLYDNNGKICSRNSYFKLSKTNNIYTLKVSLTCNKKNDYINVVVGHFDYCKNTYLCEKKNIDDNNSNNKQVQDNKEDENTIKDLKEENSFIDYYKEQNKNKYVKRKTNPKSIIEVVDITGDSKLYEYKKDSCSWTGWINTGLTNCNSQDIQCSNSECNIEEKIVTKSSSEGKLKKYQVSSRKMLKIKSIYTDACYNYVIYDSNIYEIVSDNYDTNGFMTDKVIISKTKLHDTFTNHYDLVDIDIDGDNNVTYHYKSSFYPGKYKLVNNIDTSCNTIKKIITYRTEDNIYTFYKNVYENRCYLYKRYKTNSYSDIKWSSYNDLRLLNDGYVYTGKVK